MVTILRKAALLQLFAGEGGEGAGEAAPAPGEAQAAPQQAPAQPEPQAAVTGQERFAMEQVGIWNAQAEQARAVYPGLDLQKEARNPMFRQLLRSGVDVETAYTVVHREQILTSAMHHAARVARQQLSSAIQSGAARPAENGIGGRSGSVTVAEVQRLTRQQREDIRKRAAKGEKIRF